MTAADGEVVLLWTRQAASKRPGWPPSGSTGDWLVVCSMATVQQQQQQDVQNLDDPTAPAEEVEGAITLLGTKMFWFTPHGRGVMKLLREVGPCSHQPDSTVLSVC